MMPRRRRNTRLCQKTDSPMKFIVPENVSPDANPEPIWPKKSHAKYTVAYKQGIPLIVDAELEAQAEETTFKYSNIFSTFGVLSALIAGLSMSSAAEIDAEGTIYDLFALRFYEGFIYLSFYLNLFVMVMNSALYMYCSRESHDMLIVEFFQQRFLHDSLDIFTLAISVSIALCVMSVACLVSAHGIYHRYRWSDNILWSCYYSIVFSLTTTFFSLVFIFEKKWRRLQSEMDIQDPVSKKMERSYWKKSGVEKKNERVLGSVVHFGKLISLQSEMLATLQTEAIAALESSRCPVSPILEKDVSFAMIDEKGEIKLTEEENGQNANEKEDVNSAEMKNDAEKDEKRDNIVQELRRLTSTEISI